MTDVQLANTLDAELIAAEARRAEHSVHPDAMDLVFQGRSWFNRGLIPDYMTQAHRFFEQALALDPGNLAIVGNASIFLTGLGRFEEAIALDEYRTSRDPARPTNFGSLSNNHY